MAKYNKLQKDILARAGVTSAEELYAKYPTEESFILAMGGNLPKYQQGEFLNQSPGYTNFAGAVDESQSLNQGFVEDQGVGNTLTGTVGTAATAINPALGTAVTSGQQLTGMVEDKTGMETMFSPSKDLGRRADNAQLFLTKQGNQQIDPNTGERIGATASGIPVVGAAVSAADKFGINIGQDNLPGSFSQVQGAFQSPFNADLSMMQQGGNLAQSNMGQLTMQDLQGQSHAGPNGGIPTDANGNASAASGKQPVALTEEGEIAADIQGEKYVFPKIMRNRVKPILDKVKKRPNDKATKETAELQLTQLKNENEQRKIKEQLKLQQRMLKATLKEGGPITNVPEGYANPDDYVAPTMMEFLQDPKTWERAAIPFQDYGNAIKGGLDAAAKAVLSEDAYEHVTDPETYKNLAKPFENYIKFLTTGELTDPLGRPTRKQGGGLPALAEGDYIFPDGTVVTDQLGYDAYLDGQVAKFGTAFIDPRTQQGFKYPHFGPTGLAPEVGNVTNIGFGDGTGVNIKAIPVPREENNLTRPVETTPPVTSQVGGAQAVDSRLEDPLTPISTLKIGQLPINVDPGTPVALPVTGQVSMPAIPEESFDPRPTATGGAGTTTPTTGGTGTGVDMDPTLTLNKKATTTPAGTTPTGASTPTGQSFAAQPGTTTAISPEFSTERSTMEKILGGVGTGAQMLPSILGLMNMPDYTPDTSKIPTSRLADFSRSRIASQVAGDRAAAQATQAARQVGGSAQDFLRRSQSIASNIASGVGQQQAGSLEREELTNTERINQDMLRIFQEGLRRRQENEQAQASRFSTALQLGQNVGDVTAMATRDQSAAIAQDRKNQQMLAALLAQNPDISLEDLQGGNYRITRT